MKKFLREPVLHFALLGLLLFGYFNVVNDAGPDVGQSEQIVISEADVQRLIKQHKSVWHRPPTEQELTTLVDGAVREEVLVREALALGLDQGDAAIRNRLRQKMQFLIDSAVQMLEPDDDVLRAHMSDNRKRFSQPAKIAFEQIFLGEKADHGDVDGVLAQLSAGAAPHTLGQGGLLPPVTPLVTARQADSAFGSGFFAALDAQEPGIWAGPVRSGYGLHLVVVTDTQAETLLDFAVVRDKVLFDWRRVQADILSKAQFRTLHDQYQVIAPDAAALRQALAQ